MTTTPTTTPTHVRLSGPTASNIGSHEIIGLYAEVIDATNPSMIGLKGHVTYESKFMITISDIENHNTRPKHIPKKGTLLRLWRVTRHTTSKKDAEPICTIQCSTILKRPFDRKGVAVTV